MPQGGAWQRRTGRRPDSAQPFPDDHQRAAVGVFGAVGGLVEKSLDFAGVFIRLPGLVHQRSRIVEGVIGQCVLLLKLINDTVVITEEPGCVRVDQKNRPGTEKALGWRAARSARAA